LREARFPRGVFTLSLDFELIWGTLDLFGPDGFREACLRERAGVVDRLLALLAEHEVSATWLTVGHLMLDRCSGPAHPEVARPTHAWSRGDWFADDPGGDETAAPLFFARSLIERIRACPVPQEIGGHSFSHVIYGDPGCSRAAAESDLDALVAAASAIGLSLQSFSFPRNRVGHQDALVPRGFKVFRAPEPGWHFQARSPLIRRLGHLADVVLARRPPAVFPRREVDGLVSVPGSMIYFPMHGLRRYLPVSVRVRRARKGLAEAVRERGVFHLWTHPTNLADETEAMFGGLAAILQEVRDLCRAGRLEVRTLGSLRPPGEDAA
jgi:peptidoglycan/xylan/chitin deacetylase (PgdA/CDA1 family)